MGFLRTVKESFTGYRDLKEFNRRKGLVVEQKSPSAYTNKAKTEEKQVQRYAGAAVQASGGTKPRPTIQSVSKQRMPKTVTEVRNQRQRYYKPSIGFFRP